MKRTDVTTDMCTRCGADVVWARATTGGIVAVDAVEDEAGTLALIRQGRLFCRAAPPDWPHGAHRPHAATCKNRRT